VVVALLDAGADINLATPTGNWDYLDFNFTPLMHAVDANNAGRDLHSSTFRLDVNTILGIHWVISVSVSD
jgi:hypothetical protein